MLDSFTNRTADSAQLVARPPRRQAKPADPCAMVIFGATGDLTKRLVIPALYNLSRTKVLPEHFALIGVARAEGTAESWRDAALWHAEKLCRQRRRGVRRRPYRRGRVEAAGGEDVVCPGRPDQARVVRKTSRRTRGGRKDPRHPGQRHLLSRGRRSALRRRGGAARQGEAHRSGRRSRTASLVSGAAW